MRLEAQSVTEWATAIGQQVAPVRVEAPDGPFQAEITTARLSEAVTVIELRSPPATIARTFRAGAAETRQAVFVITLGEPGLVRQDERNAAGETGDGIFCDLDRSVTLDYPNGLRLLLLRVNRRNLEQRSGTVISELLLADAAAPSVRVAAAVGRELVGLGDTLTPTDEAQMAGIVLDTLSVVLTSAAARTAPALNGRLALLRMLQADVMSRLGDPMLSPADLASQHHLSVRYVHALFTESGISCAAYIRQQRLNAAEQLLGSRAHADTPIITIAYRLGFSDPTSFIRAFRRQFGGSPSEYRASRVLRVS